MLVFTVLGMRHKHWEKQEVVFTVALRDSGKEPAFVWFLLLLLFFDIGLREGGRDPFCLGSSWPFCARGFCLVFCSSPSLC